MSELVRSVREPLTCALPAFAAVGAPIARFKSQRKPGTGNRYAIPTIIAHEDESVAADLRRTT
jgi:hypothetical protein